MSTKMPPSQGPTVVAVGSTMLAFSAFFIAMRCYTRARISKNFNFNDVFMILAVLVYASLDGLLIMSARNGVGGHTIQQTPHKIGQSLKYIFFIEVVYVILTSVMKASLAITLLQWAQKKLHIWLLWAAIAIDFAVCVAVVFFFMLQCSPISYSWQMFDAKKKGKCLPITDQILVGYALSATTVSLDMLFLFVPFFMIAGRGLNNRLKMYIYGLFGVGVLASIANFLRLAALVVLKKSNDPLFDAAPVFLWSAIEVSIGISAAGIIELRPLMRHFKVKGFRESFTQIDEDQAPIRMQSMDKGSIRLPKLEEVESQKSTGAL